MSAAWLQVVAVWALMSVLALAGLRLMHWAIDRSVRADERRAVRERARALLADESAHAAAIANVGVTVRSAPVFRPGLVDDD